MFTKIGNGTSELVFIRIFTAVFVLAVIVLPAVNVLYADGVFVRPPCDPKVQLCNPTKFDSLIDFFKEILRLAAEIGSIIAVLGFVYTGFLFVSAQGNAEKLKTARQSFIYTVIGTAVVLGAWAFSVAISDTVRTITTP